MPTPYRAPSSTADTPPPDTLQCLVHSGDRGRWIRRIYVKLAFTSVACVWLGMTPMSAAAIPCALAGLLWVSGDVRERKGRAVTLSIRNDLLRIERGGEEGRFEVPLRELADVRLDTKTTSQPLTVARPDGVNTVFGSASAHRIELDVSRIELRCNAPENSALLTKEYVPSTLAVETLRAIRLFLRSHGWAPVDER